MAKILHHLRAHGGRWINIHGSDDPYQEIGVADILGCYYGQFVAIEAKSPGGKLSRKQELFLKEVEASGGATCVAESLSDVVSLMTRLDATVRRKDSETSQIRTPHGSRHSSSRTHSG